MHNYTLVVEDSEGNRISKTSQATGDVVNITISDLKENSYYSYYVLATNQLGDIIIIQMESECTLLIIGPRSKQLHKLLLSLRFCSINLCIIIMQMLHFKSTAQTP